MPFLPFSAQLEVALLDEMGRRRQRINQLAAGITPQQGRLVADLSFRYPYAAPGVVAGMGMIGLQPDTPEAEDLARMSFQDLTVRDPFAGIPVGTPVDATAMRQQLEASRAQADEESGRSLLTQVADSFKGLSRMAFSAMSAPVEELSSLITSFGEAAFDDEPGFWSDAWRNYREEAPRSTMSMALGEWWRDITEEGDWSSPFHDREFMGEGWFPYGGQVLERREEAKENLRVGGHFATPGRVALQALVEGGVIEPGTRPWSFTSGLIDAAFQVFGDPSNLLIPGASKGGTLGRNADGFLSVFPGLRNADGLIRNPDQVLPDVELRSLVDTLEQSRVSGLRRTVIGQSNIEQKLSGGNTAARRLVREVAEIDSPGRLMELFNFRITTDQARRLAEARDYQSVVSTMREFLGREVIRLPSGYSGVTQPLRRAVGRRLPTRVRNWWDRTSSTLPREGGVVRFDDPSRALRQVDDWMKQVKAPREMRWGYLDRLSEIDWVDEPNVHAALDPVLKDLMSDVADLVPEGAVPGGRAAIDDMLRLETSYVEAARFYGVDQLSRHIAFPGARIRYRDPRGEIVERVLQAGESPLRLGDEVEILPSASSMAHLRQRGFRLPDFRELRRATSTWARLRTVPILGQGVRLTESLADFYLARVQPYWNVAQIIRPALVVKNMADNQLSLAAGGVASLGSRPLDYFGFLLGAGRRDLSGLDLRQAEEVLDRIGGPFALLDDSGARIPGHLWSGQWDTVSKGSPNHLDAWVERLTNHMTVDDYSAAARLSSDEFDWWLRSTIDGRRVADTYSRNNLADLSTRQARHEVWEALRANIHVLAGGEVDPMTRQVLRPGNEQIIDMIASQRVGDADVGELVLKGQALKRVREFIQRNDLARHAPLKVPARATIKASPANARDLKLAEMERRTISAIMHAAVGRHEARLAYGPAYTALYWDEVQRLLPWADDATRRAMIDVATNDLDLVRLDVSGFERIAQSVRNRTGRRVLRGMREAGSNGHGSLQSVEELTRIARSNAAERMTDHLFDPTHRNTFFDSMRLVSPFSNAYFDIVRRWVGNIKRNPRFPHRAEQVISGLRESDPMELLPGGEDDDPSNGPGRGMFFTNENDEEVFGFISPAVTAWLGGVGAVVGGMAGGAAGGAVAGVSRLAPTVGRVAGALAGGAAGVAAGEMVDTGAEGSDVQFVGRPEGLNLVTTQLIPGFGPVVQMPASLILRDRPEDDLLRQIFLPFGEAGDLSDVWIPQWLEKWGTAFLADPRTDRIFASTVADVMGALAASGEYSDSTGLVSAEQQQALIRDATARARVLTFLRGAAQASLPTSPQFEFSADTAEGVFTFNALRQELRTLQDELGYDEGFMAFVDRFGTDLLPVLQPKSQSVRRRATDVVGADWEREHPELVDAYPNTVGYFAPSDPDAPFDFRAYADQVARGDRDRLTPDQMLWLHNNTIGGLIYRAQRDRLGTSARRPDGQMYLSQLRAALQIAYPGFDQVEGIRRRVDVDTVVNELSRAVEDPALADNEVATAAREYLDARAQVVEMSRRVGRSVDTWKQGQDPRFVAARQELRMLGEALARRYPAFSGLWRFMLSNELGDEEGPVQIPTVSGPLLT